MVLYQRRVVHVTYQCDFSVSEVGLQVSLHTQAGMRDPLWLNRLTKRIFIDDFYLAQSGHENWCSNVFKILEKLNLEHLFYERKMVDIKEIKDQLMNKQNDMWKQAVPKKLN